MRDHNLPSQIETERLLLRRWCDTDHEPFAAMCADLQVMEFFPALLTREQADALISRLNVHIDRYGFGFWALEDRASGEFLGFTGLVNTSFAADFTPCVEVGWRLARRCWGNGFASEAARASLAWGFGNLRLDEIVSFAVIANRRSRRVMERIGMTHDPASDFDHPNLPAGHPLRRHALYRLSAQSGISANEETY